MSAADADTIHALLGAGVADAPAIGAPDRPWTTHGELRTLASRTVGALNALGFGRGDRVAIVLPNGPEAAAAFICVASGATAAPLNPAYTSDEILFALRDLGVRAIVLPEGAVTPAHAAASEAGVPVLTLKPGETAGSFILTPPAHASGLPRVVPPARSGLAKAEDTALVLHTSGTTSRPKIVPLTHTNVAASARHIGRALALAPGDVCLNIMPLFHIHGLMAATLASLAAGASVSCAPGFNAFRFFAWFDQVRPTWITAVPTMHQTLLPYAERNRDLIARGRLRLLRSSSSSLPPPVMTALEATFGVPVIESYGMTEAAHQMTSNPLPPLSRHPGSVGVAAGPEVAILDPDGNPLPPGATGEVAVRGPNVTTGYEANHAANAAAFANGWFRTGDEGRLDADGHLRLTGRLKEIINRGGEKISPLEVDAVLLAHPAVAEALCFAVPHAKLGEDIAAAIVPRAGTTADEAELRAFAAARLAAFKVPRTLVFVEEIPKGATGKLQRIGLAARLGLAP